MDLTASFLSSVSEQMHAGPLTPSALARAATELLPVDAAGISTLLELLRLPLGASSEAARTAEELQTSIGEGPCLAAAVTKTTRVADHAELTTRWPVYGEELVRQTPFRSAASVPLSTADGTVFAALDLYATDDHLSQRLDLEAVDRHIAGPAAALLSICMGEVRDLDLDGAMPAWYGPATGRRHQVWIATGMLVGRRRQPSSDALSLLRAHAYALGCGLDDLADALVSGRVTLDDLEP